MCAYPELRGKEEEPGWPSLPLTGLLVAEQKRCCLPLILYNDDDNRRREVKEASV